MCSIMGYCGSGVTFDDFKKGFDRTVSRGPDDSRVIDTGKGLLGIHRLSIMGLTKENDCDIDKPKNLAKSVTVE